MGKQSRRFSRPELRNSIGLNDCALIQFTLKGRINKIKVGTNVLHFKGASSGGLSALNALATEVNMLRVSGPWMGNRPEDSSNHWC